MAELTAWQRAAVLRTLRDIECGHITLRCSVRRFDPATGERLPERVLEWTTSDRAPAGGFPSSALPDWWELLAEYGLIRLPEVGEPSCWQVTYEGRLALTEWNGGRHG